MPHSPTRLQSGRRFHPLSEASLEILSGLGKRGKYVFCTGPTKPVTYAMVRLAFLKAAKAAVPRDVRLQDLRCTFMTRAAGSGISSHTLRDILGHKTATMADRYVRRTNVPVANATEQASGALAKILGAS